jgi:hypothetical protein
VKKVIVKEMMLNKTKMAHRENAKQEQLILTDEWYENKNLSTKDNILGTKAKEASTDDINKGI